MSKQVAVLGGVIVVLIGVVASLVLRSEPTPVPEPVPAPTVVELTVGLQPKYEVGFVVEAPCPDHGTDVFTVQRAFIAYELSVDGSPFPVNAEEAQIDALLAESPK